MRIAHIIWALETGGAETMLVDIVNEQVKSEQVAVLVVNDMVNKSLAGKINSKCKVKFFGRKMRSKSPIPWLKLNLYLFLYKPDIIHFHLEGMRKMVFHPAPKVFTIHNIHTSGREYPKYNALYAISDGVKNYTGTQGYKAITVWNGIDTRSIKQKDAKWYDGTGTCKIVCVGRLYTPHKGQDILIEAVKSVLEQGIDNFHLDLIGDGESRGMLEELVLNRGLNEKVTFRGQKGREYISQRLCEYDLFVLPSRSEGFGLSVVEAMCAKVPVIVCDLDGVKDVIDGGKFGDFFITGDANSLAQTIISFMNKGTSPQRVNDAYSFARNHFDISITARRYVEEYRRVLND